MILFKLNLFAGRFPWFSIIEAMLFPFPQPIFEARFLKRYKRFLVDLEHEGTVFTAHTANTGAMTGLLKRNCAALVFDSKNPKRKLPHSLIALKPGTNWVGVNTQWANDAAAFFINNNICVYYSKFSYI